MCWPALTETIRAYATVGLAHTVAWGPGALKGAARLTIAAAPEGGWDRPRVKGAALARSSAARL